MQSQWLAIFVTVLLWLFGETIALVVMVSKAFAWRAVADEQLKRMREDIEATIRKANTQQDTINTIMQSLGEIKAAVGFLVDKAQHEPSGRSAHA